MRVDGVNTGNSRLRSSNNIWLVDVLLSGLMHRPPAASNRWIVGGDFNFCESFDPKSWSAGGNAGTSSGWRPWV
jgi:hypothetical protein